MPYERRRGAGAIEDFDRARFGGPTRVRETQFTVSTDVRRFVGPNPDRVMLIVTNNGPDALTWATQSFTTAGTRNLLANGQVIVFQVQNDGALTGSELWGLIAVTDSSLNIVEVIRVRADA